MAPAGAMKLFVDGKRKSFNLVQSCHSLNPRCLARQFMLLLEAGLSVSCHAHFLFMNDIVKEESRVVSLHLKNSGVV